MTKLALTRVLETALYVEDLSAAKVFYGEILGFNLVAEMEGRHAFYRCGNQMLLLFNPNETRIEIEHSDFPIPTHGSKGQGHIAFVASIDEQQSWITHLEAKGVKIEQKLVWENGAHSTYFRDPSGNSLELVEERLWDLS